jgi:FkbM family methyltransferase
MPNLPTQLRSPDALIVIAVLAMLVAAAVSGMVAPAPDVSPELARFVRDNWKRYSQHDEEVLIRYFFDDRRGGVFLDVGCAWPVRNSTTYYLEHHLDWSGIAVDALDEYAPQWAATRPNAQFMHYAVSDQSGGTLTFYRGAGTGVSSLDKEHTIELSHAEPTPVEVPTITLNDLLDNAGVGHIDFMSMDIEGAEPMALAGFDIERFAPKLVCIEGRWSENAPKIRAYFEAHGYELLEEYNQYEKANWYFARSDAD